jgi:D-alanine-D-alanine ligase
MLVGNKIALVCGGPGSEREVSLATARGVAEALRGLGAEVEVVDVKDDHFMIPAGVTIVFNCIHGTYGEDGKLQRELQRRKLPYTGAGVASSELAFDKLASKKAFVNASVPTAKYQVLALPAKAEEVMLPIPVCVKPPREGSSVGVHLVREAGKLQAALDDCQKYDSHVLIEELIDGKELTVGVLGDQVLPVVHIQPRSDFYSMANKYPWMNPGEQTPGTGSDYFCPAELPAAVTQAVQDAALAAHRAVGAEVYSRVDVLLDQQNRPYVLEVNTIPGMTSTSLLPKAAAAAGIEYPQLCAKIIQLSLETSR